MSFSKYRSGTGSEKLWVLEAGKTSLVGGPQLLQEEQGIMPCLIENQENTDTFFTSALAEGDLVQGYWSSCTEVGLGNTSFKGQDNAQSGVSVSHYK